MGPKAQEDVVRASGAVGALWFVVDDAVLAGRPQQRQRQRQQQQREMWGCLSVCCCKEASYHQRDLSGSVKGSLGFAVCKSFGEWC